MTTLELPEPSRARFDPLVIGAGVVGWLLLNLAVLRLSNG